MIIIEPCKKYEKEYFDFLEEVKNNNELNKLGEALIRENESFEQMLTRIKTLSTICEQPGRKTSVFWMVQDNKVVGTMNLRHSLNEWTYFNIGNVGFYVRQNCRNKGYATEALKLAKEFYKKNNIQKILLICYHDNYASEKVILKNGGVFELEIKDFKTDKMLRRYWIDL